MRREWGLSQWLTWQEGLNPREIDLGLERTATVATRLDVLRPAPVVISVAGTNGKGSCIAMLSSVYRTAGYRVGAYTSPHILRYNERIEIDGVPVGDKALCEAFFRVDEQRRGLALTYFEFGTLAALVLFKHQVLDVVLLEVGLGGRLDAVNIVDSDCALITSIGIDHTEWLGSDREAIAVEKAGIMRADCPVICGDRSPPASLLTAARDKGARLLLQDREFGVVPERSGPTLWSVDAELVLDGVGIEGGCQPLNAATVFCTTEQLQSQLPVTESDVVAGIRDAHLVGRVQQIGAAPEVRLDVAHNPQAAEVLARWLSARRSRYGRVVAIVGMMSDKDCAGLLKPMVGLVDSWCLLALDHRRAMPLEQLTKCAIRLGIEHFAQVSDMRTAKLTAQAQLAQEDLLLVFGSFVTVEAWLTDVQGADPGELLAIT